MAKVRLLDAVTANQIAAGEVVERPAAALKELVENSLDAGATRVDAEIRAGGRELIRVTDNGSGMDAEDALLCLERHATSKLRTSEDLNRVLSLGFRGEALPSIAGVSRFELRTWDGQGDAGTCVRVEGGRIAGTEPAAMARGTSVWVRDLFHNVPARYKFMKGTPAEARACLEAIGNIAMAHPEVAIRLSSDGKEVLNTPGTGDLLDAVARVMGKEVARELVPVRAGDDRLGVRGFVGKPHFARASRASQAFFLNGRFIRSRMLASAVERAYDRIIPAGRFPAAVLMLTIDPSAVDVNVHPAKTEVRFEDESEVFRLINRAVLKAVSNPGAILGESTVGHGPETVTAAAPEPAPTNLFGAPTGRPPHHATEVRERLPLRLGTNAHTAADGSATSRHGGHYGSVSRITGSISLGGSDYRIEGPGTGSPAKPRPAGPATATRPFRVLGQVLDTYIICADNQGVVLVDQHNSHERIIYETLKANRSGKTALARQGMLVPQRIRLTRDGFGVLMDNRDSLIAMGYEFECEPDSEGGSVELKGTPLHFGGSQGMSGFEETLTELAAAAEEGIAGEPDANAREERLMVSLSCRTAIKAGKRLETREMEALVDELLSTDRPFTCPHGRPTFIRFNEEEIEKRLGRR